MIDSVNIVLGWCNYWFQAMASNWIFCIPIALYILYLARDVFVYVRKMLKGG